MLDICKVCEASWEESTGKKWLRRLLLQLLGFLRMWGLGFRAWGLAFRVWGLGFRSCGFGGALNGLGTQIQQGSG